MKKGSIYIIKNDVNDLVYIGQTSRDLYDRFAEHCRDIRSTSKLHKAIKEIGSSHFKIELIEEVELDKLDEREAYWVSYYNSYENGYNSTANGQGIKRGEMRNYKQVQVVENGLIFDSAEEMSRLIGKITLWSSGFLRKKIREALNEDKLFLDYHLKHIYAAKEEVSSIEDVENWIKTINVRYCGKHIHCIELDKDFDTISSAAVYILENGYYTGCSLTPIQNLITSITNNYKKGYKIESLNIDLNFEEIPGTYTKQNDQVNYFNSKKIRCIELGLDFNSESEAGELFAKQKIWGNITPKTAKCRISDIVRGYFPSYKGYSFRAIDNNGNIIEPPLLKLQLPYMPKGINSIMEFNKEERNDIREELIKNLNEYRELRQVKVVKQKNKPLHGNWEDYEQLAEKYKELGSLTSVAKFFNANRETVKKACEKCGVEIKTRQEHLNSKKKPVLKLDKNTLEILEEYESIESATKAMNMKSTSSIRNVCQGKNLTAYGYKWKYKEN